MSKHPYFYPVKKSHLVPMQELWSAIKTGGKSTSYFPKFKRDIVRAGELHLPQERQVRAWAKDVAAGLIPCPSIVGETVSDDGIVGSPLPHPAKTTLKPEPAPSDTVGADRPAPDVDQKPADAAALTDTYPPEPTKLVVTFTAPIEPEVTEEDPVRDAVDIIVNHYQDKAFAKARKEAAGDAARALRHFADKVEASA